jgi:hypothetical protein
MLRWLHRYAASMLPRLAQVEPPISHATIDHLPQPHGWATCGSCLRMAASCPPGANRSNASHPGSAICCPPAQPATRSSSDHSRPGRCCAQPDAPPPAAATPTAAPNATVRRSALRCGCSSGPQRGITLEQLRQAELDVWLTEHPTLVAQTRCFIAWTNRRRLTTGLDVRIAAHGEASRFLDVGEHLQQLRRCLRGDHLPPAPARRRGADAALRRPGQPDPHLDHRARHPVALQPLHHPRPPTRAAARLAGQVDRPAHPAPTQVATTQLRRTSRATCCPDCHPAGH